MVILEAMTAGLPIIATRVGGVPQAIGKENGLLFDAEAPEQLSRAMCALAKDRGLCTKLGKSAHVHALNQYSVDQMTSGYLEVFERVVFSRKRTLLSEDT